VAARLFVSAFMPERFMFRATARTGHLEAIHGALASQARAMRMIPAVTRNEESIDVTCRRTDVFGVEPLAVEEAEARLLSFVAPLVCAVPRQ
jgi:hypothetical protein